MDWLLTPAERQFRATVRAFARSAVPPDIAARLTGGQPPVRADIERWTAILHARGWAAYPWPREHGGPGFSSVERHIFEEECALAGAPELVPFGLKMVAPVLMRYGTPEQQARFLPRIARLDDYWCQGYSEPGAGSDLASLQTRAVRRGDRYVVDGQKIWTTAAHEADWIFCLVRTAREARPQLGITFLLIDLRSPGVTVRPIPTLDGRHEYNEVWFDAVDVPEDCRVGAEGEGWTIAKYLLEHERLNFGGMGFCKREMGRLTRMAAATAGRAGRPVAEDPEYCRRRAALEADLTAVDCTALRFLRETEAGRADPLQAPILKVLSSEIQQAITELQLWVQGAAALPWSTPDAPLGPGHAFVAENYLNMRKTTIYAGSNEIQRNIMARALLG